MRNLSEFEQYYELHRDDDGNRLSIYASRESQKAPSPISRTGDDQGVMLFCSLAVDFFFFFFL